MRLAPRSASQQHSHTHFQNKLAPSWHVPVQGKGQIPAEHSPALAQGYPNLSFQQSATRSLQFPCHPASWGPPPGRGVSKP